jgi:hypothetical protein
MQDVLFTHPMCACCVSVDVTLQVALSSGLMLGAVAFLFGMLTVGYLNSILLNIVDAVYIVSGGWVGGVLCVSVCLLSVGFFGGGVRNRAGACAGLAAWAPVQH